MATEVHPMVMKAAEALCLLEVVHSGGNFDNCWHFGKDRYIAIAQAALTACGALECLEALDWCVAEINRDSPSVLNARKVMAKVKGRAQK